MNAVRSYCSAITAVLLSVTGAAAQLPPPTVVPPVPNPNPSSSLVLPPTHQVPVSPAPAEVEAEACLYSILITRSAAYFAMDRAFLITGHRSDRIYA